MFSNHWVAFCHCLDHNVLVIMTARECFPLPFKTVVCRFRNSYSVRHRVQGVHHDCIKINDIVSDDLRPYGRKMR